MSLSPVSNVYHKNLTANLLKNKTGVHHLCVLKIEKTKHTVISCTRSVWSSILVWNGSETVKTELGNSRAPHIVRNKS